MRLENLYPNFGLATPEEQAKYISAYRLRRAEDMAKPPTWPKTKPKSKTTRKKQPPLTDEEKTLMKLLGIKKKDMIALRALKEEE